MKMKKNIEESISESVRIINNSITLSNNIEKSSRSLMNVPSMFCNHYLRWLKLSIDKIP